MIVDELKKSILKIAFEGRLTTRLDSDSSVVDMLNINDQSKKELISQGIVKKSNHKGTVNGIYEIPKYWSWVYIDDIAFVTKLAGFEYTKYIADNLKSEGIPLFKGKNVQNGEVVLEFESYISEELSDNLKRSQVNKKCLLTPYVGTIGNVGIFDGSFKAHLGSNVGKIEIFSENCITSEYLLYYLRSSYGYSELSKHKKATAQESISIDAIRDVLVPLPPLEEQQRIVDRIEEIYEKLDELKPIEDELSILKNNFAVQLKQSILFNYILGLPDKNIIPLNDYNKIGLPNCWKWIKVRDIADLRMGKTILARDLIENGIPVYSATISSEPFGFVEEIDYKLKKGDIVIPARGNSIGYATYIQDDVATCTQTTIGCRITSEQVFSKYFYYCCYAFKNVWFKYTGSAIPQITISNIKENYLPLPPIEEQQKIVNKIEQLLPLCEDIERLVSE